MIKQTVTMTASVLSQRSHQTVETARSLNRASLILCLSIIVIGTKKQSKVIRIIIITALRWLSATTTNRLTAIL